MEKLPEDTLDTYLIPFMHLYKARSLRALSELGLHPGQLPVLFLASRQEGQPLKQLADALHIKPPTVTVTVQRLEKAGLVEKIEDKEDQRACHIQLTPKGNQVLEEARKIVLENHQAATKGLSKEELTLFQSCVMRMTQNLKQDTVLPLSCPFEESPVSAKEVPCED